MRTSIAKLSGLDVNELVSKFDLSGVDLNHLGMEQFSQVASDLQTQAAGIMSQTKETLGSTTQSGLSALQATFKSITGNPQAETEIQPAVTASEGGGVNKITEGIKSLFGGSDE